MDLLSLCKFVSFLLVFQLSRQKKKNLHHKTAVLHTSGSSDVACGSAGECVLLRKEKEGKHKTDKDAR